MANIFKRRRRAVSPVAHVLRRPRATNCMVKLPRMMAGPRQRRTHRILATELLTVRGI